MLEFQTSMKLPRGINLINNSSNWFIVEFDPHGGFGPAPTDLVPGHPFQFLEGLTVFTRKQIDYNTIQETNVNIQRRVWRAGPAGSGEDITDPVLRVVYGLIKEEGKFVSLHNIRHSS